MITDYNCAENGMGMQDTALKYGFDTYAGFYRAFCHKYDCGPSDYLKDHKPARPCKINLKQKEPIMMCTFIDCFLKLQKRKYFRPEFCPNLKKCPKLFWGIYT